MKEKVNEKLMQQICELLAPYPEAIMFVVEYRNYIHMIDDIIDFEIRPSPEMILKAFAKASEVFSTPFWLKYGNLLCMVERMINNTYADSVEWENTEAPMWKASDAGVLRHAGIDMFFAVVDLMCGRDKLREISAKFREQAHLMHMDENLKPV